jgi:hypothetical protein
MLTSTLRPGLLVNVATSIKGNVTYDKQTIEAEHVTDTGEAKASWNTEKTVKDPKEDERARQVRGKCRTLLSAVCANSAFGLLCPENRADDLERATNEAARLCAEFNATATVTKVKLYVMTGRIAQDDVEAVRKISGELRDLLDDMREGVAGLDAEKIREAADKAKSVGKILSEEAQSKIADAIAASRSAARTIVKAGESAAGTVDKLALERIAKARTVFDLGDAVDVSAPAIAARGIDFEAVQAIRDMEEGKGLLVAPKPPQIAFDI